MSEREENIPLDESLGDKVIRKAKSSPFFVTGVATLATVCGIGAYKFKTTKFSTALYLVQLRVAAQGATIAVLTIGMAYHMFKDYILTEKKQE